MIKCNVSIYGVKIENILVRVEGVSLDYKNKMNFIVSITAPTEEKLPSRSFECEYKGGDVIKEAYLALANEMYFEEQVEV